MPKSTRTHLRRSLVDRYQQLKGRLTHKLGSATLASDALHETWMRLGQGGELEPVKNPEAYVYRAALNTAFNLRGVGANRPLASDHADLADVADEAPGPARIAEGRSELAIVLGALDELPQRQREAFLESFMGSTPPDVLAARFDVSVRTIQADIRAAVIHCAKRLGRKDILAVGRVRLSSK
ncbi:RNA polymerase sigma factor [Sphingomonas sp. PB4P5]|uniref:RNA polymerase sigma factor n=1 Tax=Parasphingomonas puruogangriensis TaxID=3096155 RepID=UPI002FC93978